MSLVGFPFGGLSLRFRPTLVLAGLVVWATAAAAHAQTVWELTPYRVQVILATGPAPELTPEFRSQMTQDLLSRVDALVGAAWNATVIEAPPVLQRAVLRDLEAVSAELVEEALWPEEEEEPSVPGSDEGLAEEEPRPDLDSLDKVILVAIVSGSTGYDVAARELDVHTRQWNAPARVRAWQFAKLRDAAFRAVWKAFAPLAQIVSVEGKDVALRLRAVGFPSRDKTVAAVGPGAVFRPVIRHNDRSGKLHGVNPIPWTFLTVEEVLQTGLTCKLHSGMRTPLSGRRRGRFEQLALSVVAPNKPTRLLLRSRTDTEEVLPGYDVYSHPPDSKTTTLVGRTDRLGSVIVPPGGHPLRVLLVKNGGAFLARLPLVPGVEAETTATIANDSQRLEAEGFITGLQEELVDLVTRREVLLAQIRSRIEENKLDEAAKLVQDLRTLDGRDDFALYLEQEQKKVFSADRLIQARIDSMFSKTRKLVNEFLDPNVVDQLDRQVREARDSGGRAKS